MQNALVLVFFLSGIAALTFEALWFRLAGLSLGNSVWSASLVLAAFMAGLTLGNGLVARMHSRIKRPIRLYAILELAIGVGGFAVVALLPRLTSLFEALFTSISDTSWLLNLTRLGTAFAFLVLPTTAMGATLPVLTDALSRSNANFGANLGRLYGWNTLGSMLGAIATETILVRWFGILGTGLIAMTFNLAAAVLALRLARTEQPVAVASGGERPAIFTARTYRYLIVGLLSGAVMLALEVVWFRFLLLTYTGTALTFAVMLTVVLGGIGLGGLAGGRLAQRDEHCYRWLPHVTAASGAFVVLTYYGFDLFTARQMQQSATLPVFVTFAIFLMLPVSVLSGMAFTMIARAVKEDLGPSMRTAGTAALWNTIGAAAGSICAGFVLLPALGMERSLFLLAAIYGLTALLVPRVPGPEHRFASRTALVTLAATAVCLVLFPFGLMERSYFKIIERALPGEKLIATREGVMETMRYYRRDLLGSPHQYRLVTNGYSMSGTGLIAKRYMKLYVYLPVALHSDTRDALLISFGVGSTAKALTDTAGLRHIDVVDISREILEMSSIIYPGADNPLRDPRVQVHVEDGRFFLGTTRRKYDLITSEPPPPKVAGVVNLYSQEYFASIREHLNPGGYASYWVPVHQLQPLDTLAITKAFCAEFEDCSLWAGAGLEWMLLGSNGAHDRVSAETFSAQWRDERVRPELVALGFESPEQVGSLFMADAQDLATLTAGVAPVTDNYPLRISDRLVGVPPHVELYDRVMDERERRTRFERSPYIDRIWPQGFEQAAVPFFRYEGMIKEYFTGGLYRDTGRSKRWEAIDDLLTNTKLETLPLWLLGSDRDAQRNAKALVDGGAPQSAAEYHLALDRLAHRDYAGALEHTHRALADGQIDVGDLSLLIYALAKDGKLEDAKAVVGSIDASRTPEIRDFLEWFEARFVRPEPAG
ncbi:MAG TPA: fused MFS/spermidine synthase [Steroidobacteraceae bacterium]|nr:fused MFS/spermidine synthase [Steroidobacteraceae bacterium]